MDIEAAIAGVAERTPGIVSMYLFGSFAEGRQHRESDVDVGVLLDRSAYPSPAAWFDVRMRLSAELSDVTKGEADVVILNEAPPQLARAIVRARRVYCRDPEADHEFARDTLLLAADIDPWMAHMRALKLEWVLRK